MSRNANRVAAATRGAFPRERLFARLERGRAQSLVWVTAPAGAGKTTLIESYLADRGATGLWYPLHAADGDPATFFGRLARIVQAQFRRRRFALPVLTPEYLAGLPAFTRRYFMLLFERLPRPVALVFDDYHELPPGSPVHAILAAGFSQCVPDIQAVVIGRHPPAPEFARLRVNGKMEMLEWPDLRLTEAETAGLAHHLTRESVAAAQARCLHEQTDGWIAGVILLLEDEARGHPTPLPSAMGGRAVLFDFFAGEIFSSLDATEQAVLQRCAVLEETTVRMAEQLSGEKAAGQILEQLYRRHCFVDRRDGAEPVYRWHALFRQFLLARGAKASTLAERLQTHHTAATLLEADGLIEAAAEQYRCAQAWPDLIRVLLAKAPGWINGGRHQILAQWLDAIPESFREQTPWLSYWRAVCRLPFDLLESRRWFERSFERFAEEDSPAGLFLSWSGVVETFLLQWDDFTGLDRWLEWLEARLAHMAGFPSPEVELRVTLAMFMALIFRRPDHPDLRGWLDRLLRLSESSADPQLQVAGLFAAAFYLQWIGHLPEAGVRVEQLVHLTRRSLVAPAPTLHCKVTEASFAWFTAAFDTAFKKVDEGLAMAAETGAHLWDHRLLAQGVYAALSQGDLKRAGAYLAKMSAETHPRRRLDVSHYHLLRSWEAFQSEDLPAALEHARIATRLAAELSTPFPEALCRQGTAHILHAMGKHEDARKEIERMRRTGRAMNSDYLEFVADLTEAHDLLQSGADSVRVHEILRRAMALGRERGFVNFPFWQPAIMSRLCAVALEAEIETAYVRSLIAKRDLLPDPESPPTETWPWRYRIFTLGGFRLLRDGEPVAFSRKIPRKPLDLLKVLAAQSDGASRQWLEDALWPDADGDRARHALETALYRLRQLLDAEAIEMSDGRLRLNPRRCWSDAGAFERLLGQTASCLDRNGDPDELVVLTHRAARLYAGPYLAGEAAPWVPSERERLHRQWCRHLERLGQYLGRRNRWEAAADCYRRALEDAPGTEAFYHCLISACEHLGRAAEAEAVRQRLRTEFPEQK